MSDEYAYCDHLIFDNSLTRHSYAFSVGSVVAPSHLSLINYKLPVSQEHFFSPPNSLKITWTSHQGGDWQVEIQVERWRGRNPYVVGDVLGFWCYSEEPIASDSLPMIVLDLYSGQQTRPLRCSCVMGDLPAHTWTFVTMPFASFEPVTAGLEFGQLKQVIIMQGLDDCEEHTLYIDELKIRNQVINHPLQAPGQLQARPYDRHVDLSWQPIADPALEYYVIHRSFDGSTFTPIGIQRPDFSRYTDYLGSSHTTVHYRITSVNHEYLESPFGETVSATTSPMDDDELLSMVQEASFRYYWEGAHPDARLALECIPGYEHVIALGASGFGLMALLVAVERGFVSRSEAIQHLKQILAFLETADRFHGVWPHFLDGRTGKVVPLFGEYDNGGDLVETAFMAQALLTARQYFNQSTPEETELRAVITRLWEAVEWDWYRRSEDSDFLFWHWSPTAEWHIDHPLIGWNETMIVYLLAIASPTHPVPASLYYSGWASQSERARIYRENWGKTTAGNQYANGSTYFDLELPVGVGSGGPLFFTHYSFLGFDPRQKRDQYTNYFRNNRILSLINYRYCVANPRGYSGYSENCWGLSASDDHKGYLPRDPTPKNDNGSITPTAALSAFPYTPEESLRALKHFYYEHGDMLWGIYGFRDAFNLSENYVSSIYMGLNQAPIVVMIENYRSGLLWKHFMANPEITAMLNRIGFSPDTDD